LLNVKKLSHIKFGYSIVSQHYNLLKWFDKNVKMDSKRALDNNLDINLTESIILLNDEKSSYVYNYVIQVILLAALNSFLCQAHLLSPICCINNSKLAK
jgi:hypothetical protein